MSFQGKGADEARVGEEGVEVGRVGKGKEQKKHYRREALLHHKSGVAFL